MIQVKVQSLGVDQATKSPVVILQESAGSRILPIWIGGAEASAIAMEMAGMKFPRPLTHDLFPLLIRGLGGTLTRVLITRVEENTYFAQLVIQRGDEMFTVDARPSDSIAIALRMQAALFAGEELFTGTLSDLVTSDADAAEGGFSSAAPGTADASESAAEGPDPSAPKLSPEQLKEYLRRLDPEDLGRFNP